MALVFFQLLNCETQKAFLLPTTVVGMTAEAAQHKKTSGAVGRMVSSFLVIHFSPVFLCARTDILALKHES